LLLCFCEFCLQLLFFCLQLLRHGAYRLLLFCSLFLQLLLFQKLVCKLGLGLSQLRFELGKFGFEIHCFLLAFCTLFFALLLQRR
jgi:hypothetical protein